MPAGSTTTGTASAPGEELAPVSSQAVHGAENGEHGPVRVIVFNDHPVFKSALTWKLSHEHEIEFVADTVSLSETLHTVAQKPGGRIDAVVADLRIGDGNSEGVDSVQTLASRLIGVPVIVNSDYYSRSFATRMNEAGAAAVVQKSARVDELVTAIHAAAGRSRVNRRSAGSTHAA